ncbi:MAG TPA: TIR domain-containing protein, partial [Polyangiaceae bacterium]|nr:TIR domain-containing protein [Polyangiaceae bacterium]
ECAFAVFVLTADDHLTLDPPATDRTVTHLLPSKESRARQNVILELGYFWGRLGRKRIAVLRDPTVTIPSDIVGLGDIEITPDLEQTKARLRAELVHADIVAPPHSMA